MKITALNFLLAILTLSAMPFNGAVAASSAPPMGRGRVAFEEAIRKSYGLVEYQDIVEHALIRKNLAQEKLKANQNSAEGYRDLADALHTLGHIEEFEENYEHAFKLHTEALEFYERTPLETRESRHKIRHANEHIFFNIYELAFEKQNEFLFRKAIDWARINNFATNPDYGMPHIRERYLDLIKRAPSLMLRVTDAELVYEQGTCNTWLGSSLFDSE